MPDLIERISLINCQTKSAMYFINKNELDNAKGFVDCIELNIKELKEIIQNETSDFDTSDFAKLEKDLIQQAKNNCNDPIQLKKYIHHVKTSIKKLKKGDLGNEDLNDSSE